MRRSTWAVCWLTLATGLVPVFAGLDEAAQKKLQGTWIAIKAERDGKAADDVVGHRLSFTGDRFQIQSKDGKLRYEGKFQVGPNMNPATVDFEHTEGALKGKAWKGIYALDGDTLKTCDNAPNLDKGRPAAFEAKARSGHILITFKRASPEQQLSGLDCQLRLTDWVQNDYMMNPLTRREPPPSVGGPRSRRRNANEKWQLGMGPPADGLSC